MIEILLRINSQAPRLLAGASLLAVSAAGLAQPTVNGLFHGDQDVELYIPYSQSQYGSELFLYFDAPSRTVFAALVVTPAVNENVFGDRPYTQSVGWGPPRSAHRLMDSEFAEFTFECEPGSPNAWTWQQGYAGLDPNGSGNYVSDETVAGGLGTPPPSYTSSSSIVWNIENYFDNHPGGINGWTIGGAKNNPASWKSPFIGSQPNRVPIGVGRDPDGNDAYPHDYAAPAGTYHGPITHDTDYQWEWAMVYEWSVNLVDAGCGDKQIFFVTGSSHHSPSKNSDEDDDFPPPTGSTPIVDLGDLPDGYRTSRASDGARHSITATGPYLGSSIDIEPDGAPGNSARGDDDHGGADEDGVRPVNMKETNWTPGTVQEFEVVATGGGQLGIWLDWNNNGDFLDAHEFVQTTVVDGTNTIQVTVGGGFDWQSMPLHARFRLFSSGAAAPGGSLDSTDYYGLATDGEVEDYQFTAGTLPVSLAWFNAQRHGNSLHLEWITATETANAGFEVMVERGGDWVTVGDFVPTRVIDSTAPTHYRLVLTGVAEEEFLLVDYSTSGQAAMHGPFGMGGSPEAAPPVSEPVPWGQVQREHRRKEEVRNHARRGRPDPNAYLDVVEPGIYRVTFDDLQAAGIDLSRTALNRLSLFNQGREIPIYVSGKGTFRQGDWIEFIAEASDSPYTQVNRYHLTAGKGRGLRISTQKAAPNRRATPVDVYHATVRLENERNYSFGSPNGDPWYDGRILARGAPQSTTRTVELDGLVAQGAASIQAEVWGVTSWPAAPDHHVTVAVNGNLLADSRFDGNVAATLAGTLDAARLLEGSNRVDIRLPFDLAPGVHFDMVALDSISITYPRSLQARDDALDFSVAGEAVTLAGLESKDVSLYRLGVTPVRLEGYRTDRAGGGYGLTFAGTGQLDSYWAAGASGIRTPQIHPVSPQPDLFGSPAEYLIISHPDFIDAIAPLAKARQARYQVAVVDVEDIYAVYNDGVVDAAAIQRFIKDAADRLGTHHVLLVGGDTYDYRDYLGLDSKSFIPSIYAATGRSVRYAPADTLYGDLDGDQVPEIPVGRMPAQTAAEVADMVAKTLVYGQGYGHTALSVSDATDTALGVSFADAGAGFVASLGPMWSVTRADMDIQGAAGAREILLDTLNEGVALAQYFGHSAATMWSFQRVFTASDATQLTNAGRPAAIVQWGCWNNYYVEPNYRTLGHQLMASGDRGAALVLGASTLTAIESDRALGAIFSRLLGTPGLTVGEALLAAKQALSDRGNGFADVVIGFTILGDPTLVIAPE